MHLRISSVFVSFYFVLAITFFFFLGDAMLNEETSIRLFADSTTYELEAYELRDLTTLQLMLFNPNYFGPISILGLLNGSRWGVLILNLLVFTLALNVFFKVMSLDRKLFVVLLLMNPITFSSLLSINKEIYSLLALSLLIYGIRRHSVLAALGCLVISVFVRWQLSLFVIVFWVLISPFNTLRHRRTLTFLILIVAVSIAYSISQNVYFFSTISDYAVVGAADWEGIGLWGWLLEIQNAGGYFLIFPVKVLQVMFGILVYIDKMIDPPELGFYNYVVLMLHSLMTLFVLVYDFAKKKLSFSRNAFYMAMIYALIFGLTPVHGPRYFYPVFVLLCILAAEKNIWRDDTRGSDKVLRKTGQVSHARTPAPPGSG